MGSSELTGKQKQDDVLNHIQSSRITSCTSQQALPRYKLGQDKRGDLLSYFASQFELMLEIGIFDSPLAQVQHKLGMRHLDHQLGKLLCIKQKCCEITAIPEATWTQLAWLTPLKPTQSV